MCDIVIILSLWWQDIIRGLGLGLGFSTDWVLESYEMQYVWEIAGIKNEVLVNLKLGI